MTALGLLAAFLLGTIATARATRLLIHDQYPPTRALRRWWWNQTIAKGDWRFDWHKLLVGEDPDESGCPWCATPYVAAVVLAVAITGGVWSPDLTTVEGWWWTLAVWASGAYLASILYVRDEPAEHG